MEFKSLLKSKKHEPVEPSESPNRAKRRRDWRERWPNGFQMQAHGGRPGVVKARGFVVRKTRRAYWRGAWHNLAEAAGL